MLQCDECTRGLRAEESEKLCSYETELKHRKRMSKNRPVLLDKPGDRGEGFDRMKATKCTFTNRKYADLPLTWLERGKGELIDSCTFCIVQYPRDRGECRVGVMR